MSIPSLPRAIPELVLREAAGQRVEAVWTNGLGGTTWQIGEGEDRDFIKMGPEHPEFDVAGEIQRLDWLAEFLPVPSLVSCGFDDDGVWIRTKGLPGSNAVAPRNVANAAAVVPALGRGLRRFHDALPVDECPFDWSVESRSSLLRNPFEVSIPAPRAEHVVVCHGDACNPNFLIGDDGEVSGFVDLGRTGVADRHADLAPAVLSLGWNFGDGWTDTFLAAYCADGLTVDRDLLELYVRLWNAE